MLRMDRDVSIYFNRPSKKAGRILEAWCPSVEPGIRGPTKPLPKMPGPTRSWKAGFFRWALYGLDRTQVGAWVQVP